MGGTLKGIDQVVSTKHEDVDSDLPHDALNHPVNREKVSFENPVPVMSFTGGKKNRWLMMYDVQIEKTMQLKPPTKRIDPIKSVSPS